MATNTNLWKNPISFCKYLAQKTRSAGAWLVSYTGAGDAAIATRTVRDKLDEIPTVQDYGAVGDGGTDDTQAFRDAFLALAGKKVRVPATDAYYRITKTIAIPDNTRIVGDWGGGWNEDGKTRIVKDNADTNGSSVFSLGTNCHLEHIHFLGPTAVTYSTAVYPTTHSNPSYGVYMTGSHNKISHCAFEYFAAAGLGSDSGKGTITHVDHCNFRYNLYGINWDAFDSAVDNSYFHHNVHSGFKTSANFNRVENCRFEWNARYGCWYVGGEVQVAGTLFDRNGWSGCYFQGFGWVVSGCYFSRNGAGGDGDHGRWNFSVPGGDSYLAPVEEYDQSHIRINYANYGVVSGCRFRYGTDDASLGSIAPKYVYGVEDTNLIMSIGNQDDNGFYEDYGGVGDSGALYYSNGVGIGKGLQLFGSYSYDAPSASEWAGSNGIGFICPVSFKSIRVDSNVGGVIGEHASATNPFLRARQDAETVDRFRVSYNGLMSWGNGTDAADVSLGRSSAGVLTVSPGDSFNVNGGISVTDVIGLTEIATPAAPSADGLKVYAKDDSGVTKLYVQDSEGTETDVTGGGGGGATTLPELTDVDDALAYTDGFVLRADGSEYTGEQLAHADLADAGTNVHTVIDAHIDTATTAHALATNLVHRTGTESIAGVKTFGSFPVTPSSSPSTAYQVANKFYVDAVAVGLTWKEPTIDKDLSDPPGAPTTGDRYIVKTTGINAWAGHDEEIAEYSVDHWDFTTASAGWAVITTDDSKGWVFDGAAWIQFSATEAYTGSLGVEKVASDFRLDLLANGGLELTGNEVGVNTDDSSIEKDGTGNLRVKSVGITNAMLAGSIADSKLSQITTASKVSGAAITALASIPDGAGYMPADNLGSGSASATTYLRGDGTWATPAGAGAGTVALAYTKHLTVDTSAVTVTTTTETTLHSYSVPAGTLSTNRMIRVTASGTYAQTSGTARTVTFKLYYGGTAAANLIATATSATVSTGAGTGSYTIEGFLIADGSASLQSGRIHGNIKTGATAGPVIFGQSGTQRAIDSASAQTLYLRIKLSGTGPTLISNIMEVELLNASDNIGAPTDASYLVLGANGNLSAERVLTPGTSLAVTDDGADGHYHIDAVQDIRTTAGPSFDHVHSTVATGTAPLIVASETMVENLNADLLDGNEASVFATTGQLHNAVTVADTSSIDMSIIGQEISAVVLPAGVNHSTLASLDTINYTHLTAANATDLTDGGSTALHSHAYDFALKVNNVHELLIDTFHRLLQGTLTTKSSSTATRTYTFGSAATDNNSAVQTWSGAGWANVGASTGRYSTLNAGYFEITILAAAGNLVMTRPTVDDPPGATTAYDANATVAISGATTHSGSWDQPANNTYTVALTAGINTIRVTGNLGVQESLGILSIAFQKYVYQGVGVAGDAVRIIYAPDWIYNLSDGIGPTDNGGVDSPQLYGESPILNMPLGTSLADTAFAHDSVIAAGTTLTGVMNTALRSFLISSLLTAPRTFPLEGLTVTLGTALTRGWYATSDYAVQSYGPTLAASVVHMSACPMLGVVTAIGAGSVLAVDQIVMFVGTDTSTAASVNARCMIYTSALAYIAGDLFTLTS